MRWLRRDWRCRSRLRRGLRNLLQHGAAFHDGLVRAHDHGKRANHEHDGAPRCGLRQDVRGAPRAEGRLAAGTAKSACQVSRFAALEQHNDDQNETIQNKKRFKDPRTAPGKAEACGNNPESYGQRNGPFHPSWHAYLLIAHKRSSYLDFLRIWS